MLLLSPAFQISHCPPVARPSPKNRGSFYYKPLMEAMAKTLTNGRANGKATYDESKIKTLSSLEHIRLRTGMYIGRLGSGADPDDGIYVLLKEVIDNAVDEFIMGCGKQIDIEIDEGSSKSATTAAASPSAK